MAVRITEYSKLDLKRLLTDDEFWTKPVLPISKLRCASQISNPRADDSDIVLITASDNDKVVAYLGILPDSVLVGNEGPLKFGWLTTWWVDKASKQRLAATILLFTALKRYSNRIAASFFSPDAKRVYDATKRFHECVRLEPLYFVMALPPSWRAASTLTRWLSGVKNTCLLGRKLRCAGLEITAVNSFDKDVDTFIRKWVLEDPLARDSSYWKWVFTYPWISMSGESRADQQRYRFSLFASNFEQIPVVVRKHGAIIAFLVLTLRDRRLSLKYAYYHPDDRLDVAAALRMVVVDINPWVFVCADDVINQAIKCGPSFYISSRRRQPISAYAAFSLPLGFRPQLGMGDVIFT